MLLLRHLSIDVATLLHPVSRLCHDVTTLFSYYCDFECDVATLDFCLIFYAFLLFFAYFL